MFHLLKLVFYGLVVAAIVFLFWFLPKYSFVQKNPGYCTQLTRHLYYCGNEAGLDSLFGPSK